jgi:hypothetical protein
LAPLLQRHGLELAPLPFPRWHLRPQHSALARVCVLARCVCVRDERSLTFHWAVVTVGWIWMVDVRPRACCPVTMGALNLNPREWWHSAVEELIVARPLVTRHNDGGLVMGIHHVRHAERLQLAHHVGYRAEAPDSIVSSLGCC